MRKLLLIFAFVACACRAYPFTSVTVSQLENKLAARPAISDAELAQRIGGLKLGERLSEAKFTSMLASLPGPLSQQALVAVADQSEFLPPPKAEIPSIAAPNAAEQSRIVELAAGYLDRTVPTLPDFIATRSTVRYQDRLLTPSNNVNSFETDLPLQLAERSTGAVLYRNHREATVGSVRQAGRIVYQRNVRADTGNGAGRHGPRAHAMEPMGAKRGGARSRFLLHRAAARFALPGELLLRATGQFQE